jgi:hypothetical protein
MRHKRTRAEYATAIIYDWRESAKLIIRCGMMLTLARRGLKRREFIAMVEDDLPFGMRTAERLMAIAADARLRRPTHVSLLPPSWGTLYQLSTLTDEQFTQGVESGVINPEMERKDVEQLRPRPEHEPSRPSSCQMDPEGDEIYRADGCDTDEEIRARAYEWQTGEAVRLVEESKMRDAAPGEISDDVIARAELAARTWTNFVEWLRFYRDGNPSVPLPEVRLVLDAFAKVAADPMILSDIVDGVTDEQLRQIMSAAVHIAGLLEAGAEATENALTTTE